MGTLSLGQDKLEVWVLMRHYFVFACFVFVLSFQGLCIGADPGVTVTIGAEGLANGVLVDLPNILISKLDGVVIPEISGVTRELLILQITYNITNISINDFTVSDLTLYSIDEGFKAELSGVSLDISFDWHYEDRTLFIIHISDSGNGTMSFSNGHYNLEFRIKERNGRPHFDVFRNNLDLSDFDLHLDGGTQWFYDLFNFIISPLVKRQIESTVQDIVSTIFDDLNDQIDQVPTTLPLVEGVAFNWALLDNFDTDGSGFGSLYSAGYFVAESDTSAVPPYASPNIPSRVNSEQGQVIISEYTLNTLGWALYEAGSLNITIPFGTTNDWRVLLPAFYRAYPDSNVTVSLVFNVYPVFTVNETGILLQMAPYMYWNAILSNGTSVNAFVLLLEIAASVDLTFDNTTMIHGQVGVPTFEMSLYDSNIGSFSLFQLETAISTVIYLGLLPKINHVLKNGIPIPVVFGFTLSDPMIGYSNDGYLYFSGDAAFVGVNATSLTQPPEMSVFPPPNLIDALQLS